MKLWPFRSSRRNDELDEELAAHLALAARDLEERGLSRREAATQARREFGNEAVIREATRDVWGGSAWEALIQDIGYGLRGLGRNPGFTVAVLVSLAVGIGASTAIFSVTDATLNQALPFPDPDRLVALSEENPSKGRFGEGASPGNVLDWRGARDTFSGIAGSYAHSVVISEERDAEVVVGAQVTEDFFPVFGVAPALGRTFSPEENYAGLSGIGDNPPPGPVVLSDRLFRRRFGGSTDVLGRTLSLDGTTRRIVGVMPASFVATGAETELWLPWNMEREYARLKAVPRDFRFLAAVGRLQPGVTVETARGRMSGLAKGIAERHPDTNLGWQVGIAPYQEDLVKASRSTLLALFAAVILVLLLTAANVANLQIARGAAREREMAVRLALGVTRGRLVRQLMTESLLVSGLGGLLGLGLAAGLLRYLLILVPPSIAALDRVGIDPRVLFFAFLTTTLVGLVSGVLPALRTSNVHADSVFRAGSRVGGSGLRAGARPYLVVVQVAIALVLVSSAFLLLGSLTALRRVDPGFSASQRLMVKVSLNTRKYRTGPQRVAYFDALVDRLSALPGVRRVGATTVLPMAEGGSDFSRPFWRDDRPRPEGVPPPVDIRMTLPGYVESMGMRLIAGRNFDDRDQVNAPAVVMINQRLARASWPGEDVVGKRIVLDYRGGAYPYEIVGVVNDTRYYGPRNEARPEVFIPYRQNAYPGLFLVMESTGDPLALTASVRRVMIDLDPTQPAERIAPMPAVLAATVERERLAVWLFGAMAAIALLLSAIGIFGVIQYAVRQTTRDIGLRMALGARPGVVFRGVLGQALRLVSLGLGIGVAVLWPASRTLESLLFGVSPHDLPSLLAAMALLVVVAVAAAAGPSSQAVRVDPAAALRAD